MKKYLVVRRGFTLVELLIVVAVVAIILVVAAPSFRDMILMQRLRSITAQLVTDLQFARNEAVSRGTLLRLVPERVLAASWDWMAVRDTYGRVHRLDLSEPLGLTAERVGGVGDAAAVDALLRRLG